MSIIVGGIIVAVTIIIAIIIDVSGANEDSLRIIITQETPLRSCDEGRSGQRIRSDHYDHASESLSLRSHCEPAKRGGYFLNRNRTINPEVNSAGANQRTATAATSGLRQVKL